MDLQKAYRLGGVTTAELGRRYGISQQSAHRIATGVHYANLPTAPTVDSSEWVDPIVRRRGIPSPAEKKRLIKMLKAYPGRRALIKQTRQQPNIEYWNGSGVKAVAEQRNGLWCVFISWPPQALAA